VRAISAEVAEREPGYVVWSFACPGTQRRKRKGTLSDVDGRKQYYQPECEMRINVNGEMIEIEFPETQVTVAGRTHRVRNEHNLCRARACPFATT
jgi:hypothetical protein